MPLPNNQIKSKCWDALYTSLNEEIEEEWLLLEKMKHLLNVFIKDNDNLNDNDQDLLKNV